MSTLSSSCRNCGEPKLITQFADLYCVNCTSIKKEAEEAAPEGTPIDERLRLGKTALSQRAHTAFKGWKNPKDFNQNMRGNVLP
jgi:hypothetical protein